MSFLDKLERALGRFAIPNLSLYLIVGQVFVLFASMLQLLDPEKLIFAPVLVTEMGEWWRIFSFMFMAPMPGGMLGFVFLAFYWYLFYLMGNALEHQWGVFRFNAFIFLSYALTVGLAFLTPGAAVTNTFILGSVFIAFAYLNPDFELTLFFVLPVKIKWLALLTVVLGGYRFLVGPLSIKLQTIAAVTTFLIFFGRDMMSAARYRQRRSAKAAERAAAVDEPRHRCHVCGKTDKSHPELDFRYCSKCAGDQCYCPEHIQNHAHVVSADDAKTH